MPGVRIGLLEDEKPQAELMMVWLEEAGYEPFHCETGKEFLQTVRKNPPDILILDWQLPDCEGIDVLSRLRDSLAFDGPVLFATGKDSEEDVVRGLSAGADDYLTKPLRQAELIARLAAVRRRIGQDQPVRLSLGPIELDEENRLARIGGDTVTLTPTEFQLARCLFSNVGKLLSREFLLRDVWGTGADLDTRTVDVHMSRIRRLLRIGPDMGYCIKTIYRHGYRLEAL
jgi:DNA-binding response OmpR family regulator